MKRSFTLVLVSAALAVGCHHARAEVAPEPTKAALTAGAGGLPETPAPFASPPILQGTPDIAALVAKVKPSVVNVLVEQRVAARQAATPFDFFGGGQQRGSGDRVLKRQAQGSGFLIDGAGHVVTNAHVVEGASAVRVRFSDDREFKAHVKGRDVRLDVAILELENAPPNLPAAALGSSEELRVGEYAVAIGNPFGLGNTVTMGIISAKSRAIGAGPYDDFIQTDASINPGNSGGPLFNLKGQVIGINTAINPQGQGIGFAIPIDSVKDVAPQLLSTGHVSRGRLGVGIQQVDEPLAKAIGLDRPKGALVGEVERGGPAERAGLHSGDVILAVDNVDVPAAHDLPRLVARHTPGSKVNVKVMTGKNVHNVDVVLDALKDEDEGEDNSPALGSNGGGSGPSVSPQSLGVEVQDAPNGQGALVRAVKPGGTAEGQLVPGDVITEVNHTAVANARDVERIVKSASGAVMLKVQRNGRSRFVGIERP